MCEVQVLLCFICLILYYPNERVTVLMNGTQLVLPIRFPLGKVTKFGLFRIIIFRSNCHFSVGGRKKPPPYRSRIKKSNFHLDKFQIPYCFSNIKDFPTNIELIFWKILYFICFQFRSDLEILFTSVFLFLFWKNAK